MAKNASSRDASRMLIELISTALRVRVWLTRAAVSAARLHRPDDVDGRSRGRARTLVGSRPGAPVPPCGVTDREP